LTLAVVVAVIVVVAVVVVVVVAGRVFAHLPITLKVFQTERREGADIFKRFKHWYLHLINFLNV